MAARIRSLRNFIAPVDEASRDDLVPTDVVTVTSLDAATTYAWSIEFAPDGSTATFSGNPAAVSPGTFTVDLVGPYLIRLTIDAGLPTEDTQYVRLRALTATLGLKLVAAGERRDETGVIPVDVSTEGWANDQNFNLQALEAAIGGGGGAETLAQTLVAGNVTGGTSIVVTSGDLIQGQQAAALGGSVVLQGGTPTSGVANGGNVVVQPGAGLGGGTAGFLHLLNPLGTQGVRISVPAADTIRIDSNAGGGAVFEYNASTGKMTVPGVLDPTALVLSDPAAGTVLYFESANGATAPVAPANRARIRYNNSTTQWEQSISGGAYAPFGGGGGTDTYTPPDVYFVDPALANDAAKRQYQTIAGALAAASGPTTIWLSPGSHNWDGSDLSTPGDKVEIVGIGGSSIAFALASSWSSDNRLKFREVVFDFDTNAVAASGTVTVTTAPLAAGDTVVVNGSTLTGTAGARTSGLQDFDASLGSTAAIAAEIVAAWNDPGNFLNTAVTASAIGSTVTFTANSKGVTGNTYTLSAATTPPGGLTVSGASLTGGQDVDISLGVSDLSVELCSGVLKGTSVDCPTPTNKSWEIVRSNLNLQLVGDATETGDGSVGGTLTITDSIIRDFRAESPLWDQDASSVGWYFIVNQSQVWVTQTHDPIPLWRNNLADLLLVTVSDSLVRLEAQGFSANVILMSGGSVGPNWIASRIVAPPFEGSGSFSFGDIGTQQGLEIEAGDLPLDAIDGTRAHQFPYGQLIFESYPPVATGAWKGDGRRTYLRGITPTVGVWYDMTDVFDFTRTVTEFSFPSLRRVVRIRGEVVVQVTGTADDGAVFPVDAVLYVDSSGGTVFKAGDIPAASYEDTVGRFLVQLIAVTGGGQEGFTVQVQTATGSVAAGSPSWRGTFETTESYT